MSGPACSVLALIWVGLCLASPFRTHAEPPPTGDVVAASPTLLEQGKVLRCTYFYDAAGRRMSYALYIPTTYRSGRPAPLLVLLHGLGSNPLQVIHYKGIIEQAEKRGYIVVAPEGYGLAGWYGSLGQGKDFQVKWLLPPDAPSNLGELSEHDVLNVMDLARKQFQIDPARIYLMGHSMGGGGALYLGMKYPNTWAALAALSPAIYSDPEELKALQHLRVMVVQGDKDMLVKVDITRRYVAKMEELGVPHEYLEIKGGDHLFSIAADPTMIGKVFDFFDVQHRGSGM